MSTSRESTRGTEQPWIHFFLADDIQVPPDGTINLIGLHPDNRLIASAEPGTPAPTEAAPHAIAKVAILVSISQVIGRYPLSMELIGATAPMKLPKDQKMQFAPGRAMNMIVTLAPLTFAAYGKKVLRVVVGASAAEFEFEVQSATSPG